MRLKNFNQLFIFGLAVFLAIALVGCFQKNSNNSDTSVATSTGSEKEKRWQEMATEVGFWVDGLGMPVDPGTKDTVIVLNLLGFKTKASCEGHLDWGLAHPWVDFDTETEEIRTLEEKRKNIYEHIDVAQKENSQDLNKLLKEMHMIDDKIEQLSKSQLMPLKDLLDNFYTNRSCNPDRMIAIHAMNLIRMYSLGGDWQMVRNNDEKAAKLRAYQQEMREFTSYLKKLYFK